MGYNALDVKRGLSISIKEELERTNKGKVLEIEIFLGDESYVAIAFAAVQIISEKEKAVKAVICLLKEDQTLAHPNVMFKQMAEEEDPLASFCPMHILNLLTPTENECANQWRKRCAFNVDIPYAQND